MFKNILLGNYNVTVSEITMQRSSSSDNINCKLRDPGPTMGPRRG